MLAKPVEAFEDPGSVAVMLSFHPLVSDIWFSFSSCRFAACSSVALGKSHKLNFVYCFCSANCDLGSSPAPQNTGI